MDRLSKAVAAQANRACTPAEAVVAMRESEDSLLRVFADAYDLCSRRGSDYGGRLKYFPFGFLSYAQMIHIKSTRIITLAESGMLPLGEPVLDSVLDLINYTAFLAEWIYDLPNKEGEDE